MATLFTKTKSPKKIVVKTPAILVGELSEVFVRN